MAGGDFATAGGGEVVRAPVGAGGAGEGGLADVAEAAAAYGLEGVAAAFIWDQREFRITKSSYLISTSPLSNHHHHRASTRSSPREHHPARSQATIAADMDYMERDLLL